MLNALQALDSLQEATPESLPADSLQATEPFDIVSYVLDADRWEMILGTGTRIVVILMLAWFVIRIVDKATARWTKTFDSLPDINPRRQRAYTVSTLFSSTARYVLWPLAIMMVLSEFNLDISALIATAGIAGIALGFGAQTLVQDFISGIFLLFDDTIHVGDLVAIGNNEGIVEYIGVRLIKVRKFNGELLMVPAGEVRTFGNKSIGYMRVVVNVGLAYEQNLDEILPVMQEVADEWAAVNREILKEDAPQVQAITELAASSVNARIIVMVIPGKQFEAQREIRQRLKRKFDSLGIEIPFPRSTVYFKQKD